VFSLTTGTLLLLPPPSIPLIPLLLALVPIQPQQVWEGDGVVASARKLIGATNPLASEPGTIRGDFAIQVGRNVIHGSDSPENGERETGACVLRGCAAGLFWRGRVVAC